jgi:cyclopropane-fatty-acyl-phospholipid synthase
MSSPSRTIVAGQPRRAFPDQLLEGAARRVALATAERIRVGRLTVVLPDGSSRVFGDPAATSSGEMRIHDFAFLTRVLAHGATGAGEAYMDGLWSSPDLPALLRLAAMDREALDLSGGWFRIPAQLGRTLTHRARRNTRAGSRRNIAAHYDLGNDFYRLFLDDSMTYSSAVFATPDQSLADAQANKYRIVAENAGLQAGQHVLEIGTGWGGFALHAAGELGCRVTTITISREQFELARSRVRTAGLEHLVDVQLRDYRDIEGTYDAIVSIEMLEAVGAEYIGTFFEICDRALSPGGRLSLQVITFPDAAYDDQLRGANWIQTYIFPGGLCPSLATIERATRQTRLLVTGVTDIATDYVRTLRSWREAFLDRVEDVRRLGFDDRFIRMWEFYLALSETGFASGLTQDLHIVMEKSRGLDRDSSPSARGVG